MKAALLLSSILLAAAPAHAATLRSATGQPIPQYNQWLHADQMPAPAGTIRIQQIPDTGACPWTITGGGRGWACSIPPRTLALPARTPQSYFLHELGHLFDYQQPNRYRQRFMALFDLPGPWRWYGDGFGFMPPDGAPLDHERFADAYMSCALDPLTPQPPTPRGYAPTMAQHWQACALIRQAARHLNPHRPLRTFGHSG